MKRRVLVPSRSIEFPQGLGRTTVVNVIRLCIALVPDPVAPREGVENEKHSVIPSRSIKFLP